MANSAMKACVLPVYNTGSMPYLDTLMRREGALTTMIWGWQRDARRMAASAQLLRDQLFVPFLFRPTDQDDRGVTHAAISALIVHSGDPEYRSIASWLHERRVERFAGLLSTEWGEHARTYYVVTGCYALPTPIPYRQLTLASENRPLSAGKKRGYAIVYLPGSLSTWYEQAQETWRRLTSSLPPTS